MNAFRSATHRVPHRSMAFGALAAVVALTGPCGQLGETIEFDRAGTALAYQKKRKNTLVIVTGDPLATGPLAERLRNTLTGSAIRPRNGRIAEPVGVK